METSRGCTFDCSFCSIIEMRGRNFHPYPIDRVLADIADARRHGAEAIFLVDDNITLDVERFAGLCEAIIDAGFNDVINIGAGLALALDPSDDVILALGADASSTFIGPGNILDEPEVPGEAKTRGASTAGRSATPASKRSSICRHGVCRRRADRRPDDTRVDRDPRVRARTSTGHISIDAVLRGRRRRKTSAIAA